MLLRVWSGYDPYTLVPGGGTPWLAGGGAPLVVITSSSLASPGRPFAETLRVLELDVAISFNGSSCAYLVRSSST